MQVVSSSSAHTEQEKAIDDLQQIIQSENRASATGR